MYVIHSMHGPTVFQFERLQDALDHLFSRSTLLSNGGLYRIVCNGKEYARVDTYATTTALQVELNREMYARAR